MSEPDYTSPSEGRDRRPWGGDDAGGQLSPAGQSAAQMMAHIGLPVQREGWLPDGHHWALAVESDEHGEHAHLFVQPAGGGGINADGSRATGTRNVTDGPSTSGIDHCRIFTWSVRSDVAAIELLQAPATGHSPRPPITATMIHDDPAMRVFLVVLEDRHVVLDHARLLASTSTLMATVDLSDDQADFAVQSEWITAVRRGGAREAGPRPAPRFTEFPVTQHSP